MITTSSLSVPTTIVPDATETTAYTTTERALDSSTAEAPSGQEASDHAAKQTANSVPGVQIETDILLLIPESVAEEGPVTAVEVPQSGKPWTRARSLEVAEDYDIQDKDAAIDDVDLDVAETLVFKPLFRHRKNSGVRRRVYRNDGPYANDGPFANDGPYRRAPFRYCPPCRYYFN
jgi:hypothetical protein